MRVSGKQAAGAVLLVLIAALVLAYFHAIRLPGRKDSADVHRVRVVATLFPLYDFTRSVGGAHVDVSLLVPPGVEAHAFEPSPSDIARIDSADVFVYTGAPMEPWAADILKGVHNPGLAVVDAGAGIEYLRKSQDGHDKAHGMSEARSSGDRRPDSGMDPHIWLDLDNAARMTRSIAEAIAGTDPRNRGAYLSNAAAYEGRLRSLDERYRATLRSCRTKVFVHGGHYAFGYLASRYGLTYVAAQGFTPDSEPSPRQLVALARQVRELSLQYVFYEELVEPRVAETLSRETGAGLLLLHGGHNVSREDFERGITFLSVMEQNLANLKQGLQCGG